MGRVALPLLAATALVSDWGNCETAATEFSNALTETTSKSHSCPAAYLHVLNSSSLATMSEFLPLQHQKPSLPSPWHLQLHPSRSSAVKTIRQSSCSSFIISPN